MEKKEDCETNYSFDGVLSSRSYSQYNWEKGITA